jgi:Lrp/AsnC family leucine-responsive transcriptional regulator
MKMNKSEAKVLTILEQNCRIPANQIAKKVRLSPEGVLKIIKRLEDRKIISKFNTKVNYSRMGYKLYPLHIKLSRLDDKVIIFLKEKIKEHKSCAWYLFCEGEYDLLLSFRIMDEAEKEDMDNLISEISAYILEKEISIVLDAFEISKSFADEFKSELFVTFDYRLDKKILKDDELELIEIMREGSRKTILELAKKLKTTPRIVMSKLKKLEHEGIISGYKTKVNTAILGYQPCIALITVSDIKQKDYDKFFSYCKTTKGIHYLVRQIGKYELELTFDVESIEGFYSLIDDIRNKFSFIKKISTLVSKSN